MTHLPIIRATNVTSFRNSIKKQLDLVYNEKISLIVTRSEDKNVVVLSESEYNDLLKTINNLQYDNKILQSILQAKSGRTIEMDMKDLIVNEE